MGTETLEKPPHAGRPHTRCSGDSAPSSCIILLSELGQYFLFCSLTIFRSLVPTIQFLLQEIYTILNTLCLESCHTYCCWDHQACQHSCHNILPGLKIASPNNSLSIISWSFLCVQRYTEDFCTSFESPVTSWTACERSAVKQSVTQHGRQTPTGTVSEQNAGTRAAREGWSVLPFICCI